METTARQYREALSGVLALAQGDGTAEEKLVKIVGRVQQTLYAFPVLPRAED